MALATAGGRCYAHPALPPAPEGAPYQRLLVDKFIAGKLRPHQVEGVSEPH